MKRILLHHLRKKEYDKFLLIYLRFVTDPEISREQLQNAISGDIVYTLTYENNIELFKKIYPFIDMSVIDKDIIAEHCNRNESWVIMEYIEEMENPMNKLEMVSKALEGKYKLDKDEVHIDDTLTITIKYPIHWDKTLELLDKHGIVYSKYYEPYEAMASEFAKKRIRACCMGRGLSSDDIERIIERNFDFVYNLYYDRVLTEERQQQLEEHIFDPKTYNNVYKFQAK